MNPLQIDDALSNFDSPVILALDYPDETSALSFIEKINPQICKLKVGNELFTSTGKYFIEKLINQGFKVFLDLKYHDIPNTVLQACKIAAQMGVWMLNIHSTGGRRMMETVANGLANLHFKPYLIAVTILTSLEESDLNEIGMIQLSINDLVLRLANLAKESGLDGVVCSAYETNLIKQHLGDKFLTVTPGIRFPTSDINDQKRVMTPKEAFHLGSDYLVIGRAITQSSNPLEKIHQINMELQKRVNLNLNIPSNSKAELK